ncbi:uncharacterized protein [Drosophila virilis]|uniref:Uncharacterized protein n=1 Tax=Drosophila virilis TaxID=7244 RepID=A0A0Q9VYJ4_DROVI|nr:uncharacterized protein LOC26531025 [Drosophila virilis]KRF77891.1 uncharacterized protein Dvir_GJ26255 [Drosophila virilis]
MPPFCCGGRRCAKDKQSGQDAGHNKSPISATDAERPLTLKFYARHDWPYFNCTDEEIRRMREKFDRDSLSEENVDGAAKPKDTVAKKQYVPKHATAQPLTENQIYGWYQHRAFRYLKKDRGIFVFPREGDPLIKIIQAANQMGR